MKPYKIVLFVLGIFAVATVMYVLCEHKYPFSSSGEPEDSLMVSDSNTLEQETEEEETDSTDDYRDYSWWHLNSEKDPMTDVVNHWANAASVNKVDLDFPYGMTRLKMTVRSMPGKHGLDVLLGINGQFHGSSYEGTNYITVRFDDEKASKWFFDEPDDGSSDWIFIRKPKAFINKLKTSKVILIEVPIYRHGRPLFNFEFKEPLDWDY